MSTGHRHHVEPSDVHVVQYDYLQQQPWFRLAKQRPYVLVTSEDLPYVAGSSVGLARIFVDRHAYPVIARSGLLPGLIDHEHDEGILLEHRWRYLLKPSAHLVASVGEERTNLKRGWTKKAADEFYEPFIKADDHEKLVRVPPDLHMEPYTEPPVEKRLLAHMRIVMAKRQQKVSKESVSYSKSTGMDRCDRCAHYEINACQLVAGKIQPDYWCRLFIP